MTATSTRGRLPNLPEKLVVGNCQSGFTPRSRPEARVAHPWACADFPEKSARPICISCKTVLLLRVDGTQVSSTQPTKTAGNGRSRKRQTHREVGTQSYGLFTVRGGTVKAARLPKGWTGPVDSSGAPRISQEIRGFFLRAWRLRSRPTAACVSREDRPPTRSHLPSGSGMFTSTRNATGAGFVDSPRPLGDRPRYHRKIGPETARRRHSHAVDEDARHEDRRSDHVQ
jgi:hypothetical protein